jgi:NAD(P)-dependent dehydrogenase (short-subunit alcohol dehydrogenase family)
MNNASASAFVPFEDLDGVSESDWDHIIAVNVKGPWLMAKAVALTSGVGSGVASAPNALATSIRPNGRPVSGRPLHEFGSRRRRCSCPRRR